MAQHQQQHHHHHQHQQHQPQPSPADWVPLFVRRCVAEIERDADRLRTDGVYRQSGNLSHVQRIRLQVDQGNWSALESVEDVHVLTGALKLFFRELKEPLIPWECVRPLLAAANDAPRKQRPRRLREIVFGGGSAPCIPAAHRPTLALLLRHLLRVTAEKEHNRMQVGKKSGAKKEQLEIFYFLANSRSLTWPSCSAPL